MNLPHLPFTIYPQHQNLMLRNLIADYCAQVLVRGKHLPLIDYSSFNIARLLKILNKSSNRSLIIDNSLKIANCKLLIAPAVGGAL